MTPKQYYQDMIAAGLSEEEATNLSGYHPIDDVGWVLGVVIVTFSIVLIVAAKVL